MISLRNFASFFITLLAIVVAAGLEGGPFATFLTPLFLIVPDYKPDNLLLWLKLLRLDQYAPALTGQGYTSIDKVAELTWEDLEEIGIQKLGS